MRLTSLAPPLAILAALAGGCKLFENGDDGQPADTDGGLGFDCTTTADCDGELVCADGTCAVEGSVAVGGHCSANRDCVTGLYCTAAGVCEAAGGGNADAACATGGDCMSGFTCVLDGLAGTCQAAGQADLGEACTATTDCLAGLVCSPGGKCGRAASVYPPYGGVNCAADSAPFKGFFEVPRATRSLEDFYRLPFPSDLRVKDNGKLDIADFPHPGPSLLGVDIVGLEADALAEDFHGFSSVAPVTFRFSQPLDFSTLQDGSALFVVDITDPQSPDFGANRSRSFDYSQGRGKFICQNSLTLSNRMNDPLEPGHTYAAWVTSAVRSATHGTPTQDTDLAALLADQMPTDVTLRPAWTKWANFRTYLQRSGHAVGDVATASVYTVGDPSGLLRALDTELEAAPLPTLSQLTLCDGNHVSPCAGDGGRVCGDSAGSFWEIHGTMSVPRYQMGTEPYERPTDGGGIQFTDFDHTPIVQGTEQVCFALTIPKAVAPATGWPLVVHAHGTGGSFKDAVDGGIAEALSTGARPMATLTFEGIGHGARRGTSTRTPDSLVFNVYNPTAARANHVQGAVDVMQALRVAQVPPFDVAGVGTIDLDPTRTYFFGHSQGSTVGLPAVALTNLAQGAVLSGAGSVLVEGLMRKTTPVASKAALELLLGEPVGGGHPVMVMWQTFYDGVDPINFAPLLVRRTPAGIASKHVLEVWGKGDTYSPESTMNNTAQAAGLYAADPILSNIGLPGDSRPVTPERAGPDGQQRLTALFQYDGGAAFDGHFVATRVPQAVADWKAFLQSLAAGAPAVP
ncbi:MAG TPA: hypothetical protein VHE35_13255 [Kofleriaceae bacterium]|nr:hypothetical protein [Kofleriaceae bacterium]